jgi:hypothetical protein
MSAGCSPCAGFFECQGDAGSFIEGRLVDATTASFASGARIRATAGGDTVETTTASDGTFALALPAVPADGAFALLVTAPGESTYVERSLRCPPTTVRGAGCPLPILITRPVVQGGGFVSFRGADRASVPATPVVFRRTSGVRLTGFGVAGDSLVFAIDVDAGHINLFPTGVFATDVGAIVGDLIVRLPPPLDSAVVPDMTLQATAFFQRLTAPALLAIGPSLKSQLTFTDGSGRLIKGVTVTLSRNSGILADSTRFSSQSNDAGEAVIDPRPFSRGHLTVDVLVDATAVGGTSFTIPALALTTHDDDETVDLGSWNIKTGKPVSGAAARRTTRTISR